MHNPDYLKTLTDYRDMMKARIVDYAINGYRLSAHNEGAYSFTINARQHDEGIWTNLFIGNRYAIPEQRLGKTITPKEAIQLIEDDLSYRWGVDVRT